MRKKLFPLLMLGIILCLSISCKLFSPKDTATPTPAYLVITATTKPTDIPQPTKTTQPVETTQPSDNSEGELIFFDDFSTDQDLWPIGEYQGEHATITKQIDSGVYSWKMESNESSDSSIYYAWPEQYYFQDFTVTLDAQQTSGNADDCDYGLFYTLSDESAMMSFAISGDDFSVWAYTDADNWIDLVPWTASSDINPGEINHLKMTGSNGFYTFYINDQKQADANFSGIEGGQLGLVTDTYAKSIVCDFKFDNFKITGSIMEITQPIETSEGSIVLFDDFSMDQEIWPLGEYQGDYAKIDKQINSGVYSWTLVSNDTSETASYWAWPDQDSFQDFTVSADAKQTASDLTICDAGLFYTLPDQSVMMSFTISDGDYSVWSYTEEDSWVELVPWTASSDINPGEMNHLKMTGVDGLYTLYINDQMQTDLTYTELENGECGLIVDSYISSATCYFEFDNFKITSP